MIRSSIYYLGMDFLDKARAFIIPYASTLFIMGNGQACAIPMKRDAEKKRILPALQFSINREPGHLAALKRDKGPMCIKATTPPRKKAPRKKRANGKTRCSKQGDKVLRRTHQVIPPKCKGHLPGTRRLKNRAFKGPKATRTLLDWVGENVICQVFEEF